MLNFRHRYWPLLGGVLLALLSSVTSTTALDIGKGAVPIDFEVPRGTVLDPSHDVLIAGTVSGAGSAGVVVRVDDGQSKDWASRFNREVMLSPGAFTFRMPLSQLKTRGGRALALDDIRRIIVNRYEGEARVTVTKASISPPPSASFAKPTELPTGRAPLTYEPSSPVVFGDEDTVTIEGIVEGSNTVGIVIRFDDGLSTNYASRVNIEKSLAPGSFRFYLQPKGLKTSAGRPLDYRGVKRIVVGVFEGTGSVRFTKFSVAAAERLPEGAKAFALAGADAPILPGMQRISPGDPRLIGSALRPITRVNPDPTVATGIGGVDFVRLPWAPGRVKVSLFTEDPGAWEELPRPLRRTIRVNGAIALARNWTAEQWIRERYLRLADIEHAASDDSWTAYGRHRGDVVSVEVDTTGTGIVIELAGEGADAKYLSAIVVEPAGRTSALEQVQRWRAEWYRSNFQTGEKPERHRRAAARVELGGGNAVPSLRAVSAAGAGAWLSLAVTTTSSVGTPNVRLSPPMFEGKALTTRVWAGQRRLELDGLLVLRDNRLVPQLEQLPLGPERARNYEIWVSAPDDVAPGLYRGALDFMLPDRSHSVPIEIEVLSTRLPAASKPAGFYMFSPPHYEWFPQLASRTRRQTECDLKTLASFGAVAGTAPPGESITTGQFGAFLEDMRIAQRNGVATGWLLYGISTYNADTLEDRAKVVGAAGALMLTSGLGEALWSAADEPSNVEQHGGNVLEWLAALRRHAPLVKLAGQLNSKADSKLVHLFDVAILNSGYGLDKSVIDELARQGRRVWLYNTEDWRLAAGIWLWQTRAQRYVQWHARSPQSDPYDPTDGREADFQMFYPTLDPCPAQPSINRGVFRLAEGIVDQRWLYWLDEQKGRDAERVRAEILRRVGGDWSEAIKLGPQVLDSIRASIIALARRGEAGTLPKTGAK